MNASQSHYRGVCPDELGDYEETENIFCACLANRNITSNGTRSECGRNLDVYQCTDTRPESKRIDAGKGILNTC